jgi:hypothetical protein
VGLRDGLEGRGENLLCRPGFELRTVEPVTSRSTCSASQSTRIRKCDCSEQTLSECHSVHHKPHCMTMKPDLRGKRWFRVEH